VYKQGTSFSVEYFGEMKDWSLTHLSRRQLVLVDSGGGSGRKRLLVEEIAFHDASTKESVAESAGFELDALTAVVSSPIFLGIVGLRDGVKFVTPMAGQHNIHPLDICAHMYVSRQTPIVRYRMASMHNILIGLPVSKAKAMLTMPMCPFLYQTQGQVHRFYYIYNASSVLFKVFPSDVLRRFPGYHDNHSPPVAAARFDATKTGPVLVHELSDIPSPTVVRAGGMTLDYAPVVLALSKFVSQIQLSSRSRAMFPDATGSAYFVPTPYFWILCGYGANRPEVFISDTIRPSTFIGEHSHGFVSIADGSRRGYITQAELLYRRASTVLMSGARDALYVRQFHPS
jgi:hypothetical protein